MDTRTSPTSHALASHPTADPGGSETRGSRRALLAILALGTGLLLGGCNTMTGMGQDLMLLGHHAQVMVMGDDPAND